MERWSVLLGNTVVKGEEARRQWEAGGITNSLLSALERVTPAANERKVRSDKGGRKEGAKQLRASKDKSYGSCYYQYLII